MKQKVQTYPSLYNLDKVDKIALFASLIFLSIGFIGHYLLSTNDNTVQIGEKIAFAGLTENKVRKKALSSLIWQEARNKEDLYYGDEIMTGENSRMEVIFLDESKLEIPEKSLVRLTKTSEGIEINLLKGAIKLTPSTKPRININLKQDKQVKRLVNAGQVLSSLSSTLPIQVDTLTYPKQTDLSDKVETGLKPDQVTESLWRENETIQLKRGEVLRLSTKEITSNYLIEVQRPDKKIETLTPETAEALPISLEGEYLYRVKTTDEQQKWSEWKSLDIKIIDQIIIPEKMKKQVVTRSSKMSAILQAQTKENIEDLEFVVMKKEDTTKPYRVFKFRPEGHSVNFEDSGEYLWQVRSTTSNEVSEMAQITVQSSILKTEKTIKKEIPLTATKKQPVSLDLNFSESAKGVKGVIEVYRADDLSNPVLSQELELSDKKLDLNFKQEAGQYLWKIRPVSQESLLAETQFHELTITDRPAKPLSPNLPEKLILTYKNIAGIDSYRIELPQQQKAKSYYLEVYRDSELKELVYKQQQASPVFMWRTTRSGHYYYRFLYTDQWDRKSPFSVKGDLYFPISPFTDF